MILGEDRAACDAQDDGGGEKDMAHGLPLRGIDRHDEADRKYPAPAGDRRQGHSTDGIALRDRLRRSAGGDK